MSFSNCQHFDLGLKCKNYLENNVISTATENLSEIIFQFQEPCKKNQCQNGAECIVTDCNKPDGFICQCSFKYNGKFCENEKGIFI